LSPGLGMPAGRRGGLNGPEVRWLSTGGTATFVSMDPTEVLARLNSIEPSALLDHFSAPRAERADRIQRYFSDSSKRDVAENLIELEIDGHTRGVVISLLRERQAQAVGF